jgi:serine/threonine protein kinase
VSESDDTSSEAPRRKEPQPTVAWDPDDIPGLNEDGADEQDAESPAPESAEPPPPAAPTPPPSQQPTMAFDPAEMGLTGEPVSTDPPPETSAPRAQPPAAGNDPSDDPDADPLLGTLIRGKWRVLKRLGAGSFGTVYKVKDEKGGWIEALKILAVDRITGAEADVARKRFLREAQIMKRLGTDSQHIVGLSTYEEDLEGGLIYFLMEMVDGGSLADALEKEGPFPVDRAIRLALQTCDALSAAHEGPEGVVHRDLKLENLMLATDRDGQEMVKVLDFGIATLAEKEADTRLTTVGTLGTPGYAAPEQLRAEDVDARTDLFAFGVILYSLLTGVDPWLGNPATEPTPQLYDLMVATERGQVRPMADTGVDVPPAMENLIMKLLRRDPADRYQSAREVAEALRRVSDGGTAQDVGSLRVLTDEPGVDVEIRHGRRVIVEGPTPCVANGIPIGSYRVVIKDPRYEPMETTVEVAAGAIDDCRLVTTPRSVGAVAAVGRHRGRMVAAIVVLLVAAGALVVRPWGRTLAMDDLLVRSGSVSAVRLGDGGVHGTLSVGPVPAPFVVPVSPDAVPATVTQLRQAGINVDTSWEVARLIQEAVRAQAQVQYFGNGGEDVLGYAQRAASLDPESPEARSLILKVAERMAWDADAASADGDPDRAAELIGECLALIPDHPGCVAAGTGP